MKLLCWNVNGIRAVLNKGALMPFVEQENPDILCLQETKAHPSQVDLLLDQYEHYWSSAEKKGYAGTAVFTKIKPLSVNYELPGVDAGIKEGRIITLDFPQFYLVNVYTPNSKDELQRLKFRSEVWDEAFLQYIKGLDKKKSVVICGDLNVAHKEIDLARPKTNHFSPGFTKEERQGIERYINAGFLDTFREFNDQPGHYTWWSFRARARENNVGWRIDYFLISQSLRKNLVGAQIYPQVMGSDHCPVGIELAWT